MSKTVVWVQLWGLSGYSDQAHWPTILTALKADLQGMFGPRSPAGLAKPSLILLAGDLAHRADPKPHEGTTPKPYDRAAHLLGVIRDTLCSGSELSSVVLAVPGPGDIEPISDDESLMFSWLMNPTHKKYKVHWNSLWDGGTSHERVRNAFASFQEFARTYSHQAFPQEGRLEFGILPGDLSASWKANSVYTGALCFNTAWFGCSGETLERQWLWDLEQANRLLKDKDTARFCDGHHITLLLQHHGAAALSEKHTKEWEGTLEPHVSVALHTSQVPTGEFSHDPKKLRAACGPLFGTDQDGKLSSSYLIGQAKHEGDHVELRVWPRVLVTSSQWSFRHPQDAPGREAEGVWLGSAPIGKTTKDLPPSAMRAVSGAAPSTSATSGAAPSTSARPGASEPSSGAAHSKSPTLEAYKAHFAQRWNKLPVLGIDNKQAAEFDIEDTYVSLYVSSLERVTEQRAKRGGKAVDEEHGSEGMGPSHLDLVGAIGQLEQRISRDEAYRGLCFLGNPGSGKTTLLKHIFVKVARDAGASLGWKQALVPVFLRLRRVGLDDLVPGGLAGFVRSELKSEGYELAAEQMVGPGGPALLFLLDGLDEQGDEAMRQRVCRWLAQEIGLAQERGGWPAGSRFLMTSRYAGWTRSPELEPLLLTGDVLGLNWEQTREFVGKWYVAVTAYKGQLGAAARQRSEGLLWSLQTWRNKDRKHLELTSNPLLLSMLCLVHYEDHKLPDERGLLYTRCLELLLQLWGKHTERKSLPFRDACLVLQPLAWELQLSGNTELAHQNSPQPSQLEPKPSGLIAAFQMVIAWLLGLLPGLDQARGQLADPDAERSGGLVGGEVARAGQDASQPRGLDVGRVKALITEALKRVPDLKDMTWEDFVGLADQNCGVLQNIDTGIYQFVHLSFQEYLAACHAQARGLISTLVEKIGDERWKEVTLLAINLPGMHQPFMRQALAAGALEKHPERLTQCLQEARTPEPEVFGDWLRTKPSSAALLSLFRVFGALTEDKRGYLRASLQDEVRSLATHKDPKVQRAAKDFMSFASARSGDLAEGQKEGEARVMGGLEMVWVPAGTFWMGSSKTQGHKLYDPEAYNYELPGGEIELTKGYWIGRFPVTNEEYRRFVTQRRHRDPGQWSNARFNQDRQPVVEVDFNDAAKFCAWLTQEAKLPAGWCFALPTEAQWERAARGTDGRKYPWDEAPPSAKLACFAETSNGQSGVVGERPAGASPCGCQDMAGNVWEWCRDAWADSLQGHVMKRADPCHMGDKVTSDSDPRLPNNAAARVLRGGSWLFVAWRLRCAYRDGFEPEERSSVLGFRVVCVPAALSVGR
jgi:formylglycine-generating enzyme required for sulfatase activity